MRRYADTMLGLVMLLVISLLASQGVDTVAVSSQAEEQLVVALDPGHGGVDPGKVGGNNALEKDLNLSIGEKVRTALEEAGIQVIMTRETDVGLYQESDRNKKIADLSARSRLIEESGAVLTVSIHQNSYHDSSVQGPQVFYYKASQEGKLLAETLQASFEGVVEKNRPAKANDNYYLLLHTSCPTAIVECGFLSNPEEAELLCQDSYQQMLAEAIAQGVLAYLEK